MIVRYRLFLILCGVLLFPLVIWLGLSDFDNLVSFFPYAHSTPEADDHGVAGTDAHKAAGTDDHREGEADEHENSVAEDHRTSVADAIAHTGPILLPQKRTTLLSRVQLRGYVQYQYYCASCHGKRGNGDGSNARNLGIPPRRHNDASYMANLSDTYLSRIIEKGGASQGLSPLMPPWGGVLSDEEISNLIAFLRILPDSRMMASAEEHQKSAGMGGHQHGGTEAEDHHRAGEGDHHAADGEGDHAAGTDDHHTN